mgnify:CR=1 FL=1
MKTNAIKKTLKRKINLYCVLLTLLLLGCTGSTENKPNQFNDITEQIEKNPSHKRYGVATTLINSKPAAFVTGFGGPNQLLTWQDGTLQDITPDELKDPESDAIGAAWCDIDQDGDEELYVLTTDTYGGKKRFSDKLYDKTPRGWIDRFENSDVPNRFAGRSVACTHTPSGPAFFVARYGGPMQLITYQNGSLKDIAPRHGMDRVTGGRSIINIPTENGVDIFVGNERGPNFYYQRQNNTYQEIAQSLGVDDPYQNARGVDILDLQQDNSFDIVLGNWEGPHRLYKQKDNGYEDIAPSALQTPTPIRSVIAADFNNDGVEELFLNNIGAPNSYHEANGTAIPLQSAREPNGLGTGATTADFNQDGKLELLIAHGETGAQPLTLYQPNTEKPGVQLRIFDANGAPARNARVEIRGKGVYAVDGGSAYLNQMSPEIHVGGTPPLQVKVTYPDGTTLNKTVQNRTSTITPQDG